MSFPNKIYLSLNEVSVRWNRKVKDVEYCIENGLLAAHIKVCSIKLETQSNANTVSECEFTGCKRLKPEDCHILFRHYKRAIYGFFNDNTSLEERLVHPERLIISKVDLIIFLKDIQSFERKYNLNYEETQLPLWDNNQPEPIQNVAISNDCDIFRIGKDFYTFGPIQARIIKELQKAATTPNPWLLGKNLLADSGSRTQHLKDLFKSHPILPRLKYKAKGYYRLSLE